MMNDMTFKYEFTPIIGTAQEYLLSNEVFESSRSHSKQHFMATCSKAFQEY
jgi:hypothetical protein